MLADAHISSLGYLFFKMAQKTAFDEAKERLYTTGEEIQRLFIIDLYT